MADRGMFTAEEVGRVLRSTAPRPPAFPTRIDDLVPVQVHFYASDEIVTIIPNFSLQTQGGAFKCIGVRRLQWQAHMESGQRPGWVACC